MNGEINSFKISYYKKSPNEYEIRIISPIILRNNEGNPVYCISIQDKSVFNIYKDFRTDKELLSDYAKYDKAYNELVPTIKALNIASHEENHLKFALYAKEGDFIFNQQQKAEKSLLKDLYNPEQNPKSHTFYTRTSADEEFILYNPNPVQSVSEYISNKNNFFATKVDINKTQEVTDKLYTFIYGLIKREIAARKTNRLKQTNRIGRLAKAKLLQRQR